MAHLLHIVKHIDRNEYRESRFLIVMRLVSMMNQCFESVYMSQNSLPVGESGSQSYLLSRANQSTDFDGESEPGETLLRADMLPLLRSEISWRSHSFNKRLRIHNNLVLIDTKLIIDYAKFKEIRLSEGQILLQC